MLRRYLHAGMYAWMFAWFKTRLDSMFRELPEFVKAEPTIRTVLDIGCGYGVAGSALLEWIAEATIYGVDPNPRRVHVAAGAFGERGQVKVGAAPDFTMPVCPEYFDAVLMLDMIHFIPDEALALTLERVHARLKTGGRLIVRSNIPPSGVGSLSWRVAVLNRWISRSYACHRQVDQIREAITAAGFEVIRVEMSGGNPESYWFIATA
jgi:SAM-dependent methyltransferase